MLPDTVRFAIVIPAYRPEPSLFDLIEALCARDVPAIVLVDDGSGPEFADLFRRAAEFPNVRLVRHAVNLGKGAALKSGINAALCAFPDLQGVVTADADGQHPTADVLSVADALQANPGSLIMGVRAFKGEVPLRSRFGNAITRVVMHALVGHDVSDTQTGLRGIPATLLPHLLRVEVNGYDFELDMLIAVRRLAVPIVEVPIQTIYEPGNRTSHFNPLVDSMKIYFVLLRFSSVSLMTAVIDSLVFYLAYRRLGNVGLSQILGRILAVIFNYLMVRRAVFFSRERHLTVLPKYLLLVCVSGAVSYAGIELLHSNLHLPPVAAKLIVESLLFFANFAIQRDFIFGKSRAESTEEISKPASLHSIVLGVASLVLLAIEFYGFRTRNLFAQELWTKLGLRRLLHYTEIFWLGSAVLLLLVPWGYGAIAGTLAALATVRAFGPLPLLAAAAFLLASCALGMMLIGRRKDLTAETQLCATMLGIAVYMFLLTFLVRLPVNYPAVYVLLLAVPIALDFRGVARRLASWARASLNLRTHPLREYPTLLLLVFVLGMHWLVVLKPEASADGLSVHLAVPLDIAAHHVLTYHPSRYVWAVMPMGADWCYTMACMLGGEFGARLLNFAMLLVVLALLYRAVRRWVSPAVAYLILALFATTPIVQTVTGGLMVENLLAAMVLAMVTALWQFSGSGENRFLYAAAALGGSTVAIKLGGLAFVSVTLPFAIAIIRRPWKHSPPAPRAPRSSPPCSWSPRCPRTQSPGA